jgi:hypothetical protein
MRLGAERLVLLDGDIATLLIGHYGISARIGREPAWISRIGLAWTTLPNTSANGTFAKCRPGPGMSDAGGRPDVVTTRPNRRA